MTTGFASLARAARAGEKVDSQRLKSALPSKYFAAENPAAWGGDALMRATEECRASFSGLSDELAEQLALGAAGTLFLGYGADELVKSSSGERQLLVFEVVALRAAVDAARALFAEVFTQAAAGAESEQLRVGAAAVLEAAVQGFQQLLAVSLKLEVAGANPHRGFVERAAGLSRAFAYCAKDRCGKGSSELLSQFIGIE